MSDRYYICGRIGSGTEDDPYRPEVADEPGVTSWAANQQLESLLPTPVHAPRFIVWVLGDAALHAELGYSDANPDGFDYFEVADDGTVTLHAAP